MTTTYIFLSVFLVSLASLAGVTLLSIQKKLLNTMLMYLVSFATGAIFANVFFHILPEMVERTSDVHLSFMLVLLGLLLSFIIEKFIHWHHCHNLECSHIEPLGTLMIIGDGVHNVIDGILIATSFLIDIQLGITTTIVVILHEIPQEIGDFAVLLHSGFSRGKALLWNFCSALTAFLGAAGVLLLDSQISNIEMLLLPIAAGNFLYIAGSDLIPELHKQSDAKKGVLQLLCMIAGIALLYTITNMSHVHANVHHDAEHIEEHATYDEEIEHTHEDTDEHNQ